ncbi:MAG: hypothetical protein LBM93_03615 [Oscillospiraceae bacterium]|nr:hypothetical protein [Oscillospiraceae bacterium]
MKSKGIKVKRGKSKRFSSKPQRKKNNILKIIVFIIILCVIAFVGYSVLAPILDVLNNPKKEDIPEITTPAVVTTVITNKSDGTTVTTPSETQEEKEEVVAFYLNVSALTDINALTTALDSIPKAPLLYNAVVIPLKSSGGAINYATTSELSISAKSNKGTIPLADILQAVKSKGYEPIAQIDMLQDNIYPQTFGDTSYTINGSGSRWYDNAIDKGGKLWLSPFASGTKTYLSEITNEVNTAGFTNIIFTGAVFPPFRQSDLNQITNPVKSVDRYTAITDLLTDVVSDLPESNPAVTVSVSDIFAGKADVLKPEIVSVPFYVEFDIPTLGKKITVGEVVTDIEKLTNTEKFRAAIKQLQELYPTLEFTPVLSRNGLTDEDLAECDMLCDEYNLVNLFVK